jgi:small subunit ribosomal protein S18
MAKKSSRNQRGKDPNPRKYKKKTSPLVIEKVEYVDYKDVDLLSRFMSDRAKIRNLRVTGNNRQQQLEIANAIKIAREMALLPYARRAASASRSGGRGRDGGRDGRDDRERRPSRDDDQLQSDTGIDDAVDTGNGDDAAADVEIEASEA